MEDKELTEQIIACPSKCTNIWVQDFWKKFMRTRCWLSCESAVFAPNNKAPVAVFYDGQQVGEYFADLLVEEK